MSTRGSVVVIDSNVWISGMLTKLGAPAQLIRQVVRVGRPVFTQEIFAELKQRLWLPKFDRYVSIEDRRRLLHEVDTTALWIDVSPEIAVQHRSRAQLYRCFAGDSGAVILPRCGR